MPRKKELMTRGKKRLHPKKRQSCHRCLMSGLLAAQE
jgi:hypothetical protein